MTISRFVTSFAKKPANCGDSEWMWAVLGFASKLVVKGEGALDDVCLAADKTVMKDRTKHSINHLKELNDRFLHRLKFPGSRPTIRRFGIREEQKPHSVVLTCSDSRLDPAIIFDVDLGELFVVRVAGNIWEEAGLAATEFAVNEIGCSTVLVLGHTGCGAIAKAMELQSTGNVPEGAFFHQLISQLVPAVEKSLDKPGDLWENSVRENVNLTIADGLKRSLLLRNLEKAGRVTFVGGIYDIESGRVEMWDPEISD